jgi:cobalt-zinc-cadmium efflux system membrane fusion protein
MFVTATFSSRKKMTFTMVPADAVLHLHDRDWVYLPVGGNQFKRAEVRAGNMLEGNRQEILSGLDPGQKVVTNALLLETAGNQ